MRPEPVSQGSEQVAAGNSSRAGERWAVLALVTMIFLLSLAWRRAVEVRVTPTLDSNGADWIASDPDGLYHARRVDRALTEGLPVSARDPLLAFPDGLADGGSAIPWPPAYTWFLYALAKPGSPLDANARRARVEQLVASVPAYLSALLSALIAFLVWRISRLRAGSRAALLAAVFAGSYHAATYASLRYAHLGNGDHHAWIDLWLALLLVTTGSGLWSPGPRKIKRALLWGLACGVCAAVLITSWVAGLMYVVLVQGILGGLMLLGDRNRCAALAAFGLAFQLLAAACILPSVLASPHLTRAPWGFVDLSFLHVAELLCGASVCAPLLLMQTRPQAMRRYALGLTLTILLLAFGLARDGGSGGLREAWSWLVADNAFMGRITESQPLTLLSTGNHSVAQFLGLGIWAVPVACLVIVWGARGGAATPWIVAVPFLLAQAFLQRRFADALAAPLALVLGCGLAVVCARWRGRSFAAAPRGSRYALAALCLLVALGAQALHPTSLWTLRRRASSAGDIAESSTRAHHRVTRSAAAWLRAATDEDPAHPTWSVMAQWDLGHLIEWGAERATVASNFGSYLGPDSYLDPWRFFLAVDSDRAQELLRARRSRFVFLTSDFRRNLATMQDLGLTGTAENPWTASIAARLLTQLGAGRAAAEVADVDFLRLVHLDQERFAGERTATIRISAWVFEHVVGAQLVAQGQPGSTLVAHLRLSYPGAAHDLTWRGRAVADERGRAALRVPYCTVEPNGDGVARAPLSWSFEGRSGDLAVEEQAVIEGLTLSLDPPR